MSPVASTASCPLPKHSSLPKGTQTCPNKNHSCSSLTSGLPPPSSIRCTQPSPKVTATTVTPPAKRCRRPSGRRCWRATATVRQRGRPTAREVTMGADLYINSLYEPQRARWEQKFEAAVKHRDSLPADSPERDEAQIEVDHCVR